MLFKKLRAKLRAPRKKADKVVSQSLAYEPTFVPLAAVTDVVLPQPAAQDRAGHLGMQGYAPKIAISQNRRYCEYCADRVLSGVRHVCWGNAEHHMHTLNHEERTRIMAQLAAKPKKLTRVQLKNLYAADRLGSAVIEGRRYGD